MVKGGCAGSVCGECAVFVRRRTHARRSRRVDGGEEARQASYQVGL